VRKNWHRKLEGIEMEAEGVGQALKHSRQPFNFLVIKGISDYGDLRKNDGWHKVASHTAAQFLKDLLTLPSHK
jgi:nucleoside phosphorylase